MSETWLLQMELRRARGELQAAQGALYRAEETLRLERKELEAMKKAKEAVYDRGLELKGCDPGPHAEIEARLEAVVDLLAGLVENPDYCPSEDEWEYKVKDILRVARGEASDGE